MKTRDEREAVIDLRHALDDWLQFETESKRKVIARRRIDRPFGRLELAALDSAYRALTDGAISLTSRVKGQTISIIAERLR